MSDDEEKVERVAKAICQEKCAFMGEPACWIIGDGLSPECNDPGCHAEAVAALAAMKEGGK